MSLGESSELVLEERMKTLKASATLTTGDLGLALICETVSSTCSLRDLVVFILLLLENSGQYFSQT